jgi:Tol biopolymer transport system component
MRLSLVAPCTLLALALSLPAGAAEVQLLSSVPAPRASDTASGASRVAALSGDGRWVAFLSSAANLLPGVVDENGGPDLFLYDRGTGETVLVSRSAEEETRTAAGSSGVPSLSADGRYLAFVSGATDLVPGVTDENRGVDVFLYDRVTGTTELVSHAQGARTETANRRSYDPVVSADGQWVAFPSRAADLVPEPVDGRFPDLYLWERRTGEVRLVSRSTASPVRGGSGESESPSLSADGRYVAFLSNASDLVPGQREGYGGSNVFLFDRVSGRTAVIDHASWSSTTTGNGRVSDRPRISADGGFVAYASLSTDLVAGARGWNRSLNVFLFERASGRNTLVSHAAASPLAPGDRVSTGGFLSADGSFVVFSSQATDLVPGQDEVPSGRVRWVGVFLYARSTGRVTLVSGAGGSATKIANRDSVALAVSGDGGSVLFESAATDLVPGVDAGNDFSRNLYLWDRGTARAALVSHGAASAITAAAGGESSGDLGARLSADGQWIAFASMATDLVAGVRDTNAAPDAVLQAKTGGRTLLTRRDPARPSATPHGESRFPSISADGRYVAFTSEAADLVPGRGTNSTSGLFLADRVTGVVTRVSRKAGSPRASASGNAQYPRISADGRFVAYMSTAPDVVPGQVDESGDWDIFLWDRTTGATVLVSRTAASPVTSTGGFAPVINADGSVVAFQSSGKDLVAGQIDDNESDDVFLWDRATGTTVLASRAAGTTATVGNLSSFEAVLDASGRFVAFTSISTNLVAGVTDTNEAGDVFLFDRAAGTTALVSRAASSPALAARGETPVFSADGRFIAFASFGTDLVAGQTAPEPPPGPPYNLFLWDRESGVTRLVTHPAGSPSTAAGRLFQASDLSADGRFLAFASWATNLAEGQEDGNDQPDVFLYDRETNESVLVSRAGGAAAALGAGYPKISADGRFVAFLSVSADLLPGGSGEIPLNVFRYDRQTGAIVLASRALAGPDEPANGWSEEPVLSADGAVIAFTSRAATLTLRDFNRNAFGPLWDVFAATFP